MDNDALDFMDQFKGSVVTALECLRGLTPAAVQNGVGGGDARGRVASLLRMMPTSTLIAVRVWLRASERISVMVLFAIYFSYQSGCTGPRCTTSA